MILFNVFFTIGSLLEKITIPLFLPSIDPGKTAVQNRPGKYSSLNGTSNSPVTGLSIDTMDLRFLAEIPSSGSSHPLSCREDFTIDSENRHFSKEIPAINTADRHFSKEIPANNTGDWHFSREMSVTNTGDRHFSREIPVFDTGDRYFSREMHAIDIKGTAVHRDNRLMVPGKSLKEFKINYGGI
ncbi:MAG: hypothetical protein JSV88_08670 [Candidatus Aminicenantes bacterium]|nr:MAG: hypothetical protein JSV88_08670 [Candidatus Aminicenantes bacterium]